MRRPLWAIVGVALLATTGITGVIVVASPGGEEEVDPAETATTTELSSPTNSAERPTPGSTVTYTDAIYGYSFDYPAAWYLSASKDSGGVTTLYSYDPAATPAEEAGMPVPPDKLKVEFVVLGNPKGSAVDAWIAESRASGGPVEVTSRSAVTVDNTAGIAETGNLAEGPATQYFIPSGRDMYVISKYPSNSLLSKEFAEMLASFKF